MTDGVCPACGHLYLERQVYHDGAAIYECPNCGYKKKV